MSLSAQAASQVRDQLLKGFDSESKVTLKVLRAIPNDKLDFKPHVKSMSMGELAWHTAQSEHMFIEGILKGSFGKDVHGEKPAQPRTVTEIADIYEKQTAQGIAALKELSGDALAKELNFYDFMIMPAIQFLNITMNHSIHHRGQLTVYLRLVDAKVPSTYGPSADDNPFA